MATLHRPELGGVNRAFNGWAHIVILADAAPFGG
jgi:hypothetical protein